MHISRIQVRTVENNLDPRIPQSEREKFLKSSRPKMIGQRLPQIYSQLARYVKAISCLIIGWPKLCGDCDFRFAPSLSCLVNGVPPPLVALGVGEPLWCPGVGNLWTVVVPYPHVNVTETWRHGLNHCRQVLKVGDPFCQYVV